MRMSCVHLICFVAILAALVITVGPSLATTNGRRVGWTTKVFLVPRDHPDFDAVQEQLREIRDSARRTAQLDRIARMYEERGTEIAANPTANGAVRELHKSVTECFRVRNPVPPPRLRYFEGIAKKHECVITGWYGTVRDAAEGDDGCFVEVQVSPHLASMKGGVPYITDYCIERWYLQADGSMQFIGLTPGDGPKFFFSD